MSPCRGENQAVGLKLCIVESAIRGLGKDVYPYVTLVELVRRQSGVLDQNVKHLRCISYFDDTLRHANP